MVDPAPHRKLRRRTLGFVIDPVIGQCMAGGTRFRSKGPVLESRISRSHPVRDLPDWARQESSFFSAQIRETAVTVIDFTAFIGRLATASGETILPFFRTSLSIDNKSVGHDFDPVTEADRAAEAVMRRLIKANFPQHGIVGEEFGSEREDAEYVWVLDPIDGTKSFIAGFPIWGTLIALLHQGTPVFGMMHQPFIGERFSGDSGSAHYRGPSGERKLAVRRCSSLRDATMFTTSPLLMNAPIVPRSTVSRKRSG